MRLELSNMDAETVQRQRAVVAAIAMPSRGCGGTSAGNRAVKEVRVSGSQVLRSVMASLIVVGGLGAGDYLVGRYLPNYQLQQRAHNVQTHVTVFLGKLGQDAQLRGLPIPGPARRPNAQAWQKLRDDAKRDPATLIDAYVLE